MAANAIAKAIQAKDDSQRIKVRVGRIWEAINRKSNTTLHTNIVFIDDQDEHILAIIRNNQRHLFLPQLKENCVYNISNFKIVPGPVSYRSVDRDMAINFFYKTKIEETENTQVIPTYKFELQPFHRVQSLVGHVKNLIDVIGMVTTIGRLEKRTNGAEKMDVALTDNRNEKIIVTLWEERAYQFKAKLDGSKKSPLFVVITRLLAKKFSDKASLSSTDATRSYFNIDYKPLRDLKETLSNRRGNAGVQLQPPTNVHFVTTDPNSVQQLNIREVLETQIPSGKEQLRCLCTAKIMEILNGNGWMYNCCSICARAVHPTEGTYSCSACNNETITVSQRYRVVARIQDDTGTTTVTLFNKEAEQLIGVPIQKLLTEIGEGSDMDGMPPAVKNLIGKICAFQIKITDYNITHGCEEYIVARVSECSTSTNNTYDKADSGHKDKRVRLE